MATAPAPSREVIVSNRRKILRMNRSVFPGIFSVHPNLLIEVDRDPLPPDTRVVNVRMGDDFQTLIFLLESEEFDEVAEGHLYPEITPMLRSVTVPDRARLDAFLAAEHDREPTERLPVWRR